MFDRSNWAPREGYAVVDCGGETLADQLQRAADFLRGHGLSGDQVFAVDYYYDEYGAHTRLVLSPGALPAKQPEPEHRRGLFGR